MKKVLVGMFALVACAGMAMAGTRYIEYTCGHTEAVGSTSGASITNKSSSKCANCAAAEQKEKMCENIYGKVDRDTYKQNCE
ncbi:MAG: hypothetical protein HDR34_05050 [Treponema sp.]|nr:hypothetical protein [Treponema sp.]